MYIKFTWRHYRILATPYLVSIHKIWKLVEGGLVVGVASACSKVGHNLGSFENTRNEEEDENLPIWSYVQRYAVFRFWIRDGFRFETGQKTILGTVVSIL